MQTKLSKDFERVYEITAKCYEELLKYVKDNGGELMLDENGQRVRHVWLDNHYKLQGDYISRIRVTECTWNGALEVLPEYTDPNDEFNWVSFSDESDFVQFNLDEIIRFIDYLNR